MTKTIISVQKAPCHLKLMSLRQSFTDCLVIPSLMIC